MSTKPVWSEPLLRHWIEIDGLTHDQIASLVGTGRRSVGKAAKRFGIECHRRGPRSGAGHPDWRGGRTVDKDGYVLLWVAEHPARRRHTHYMLEHRLVMESVIGRYLEPHEVVHHKNGDKQDNRPENLELFQSNADHLRHELTGHCPEWTADGEQRIRDGVNRYHAERRAKQGPRP